jgi:hypothetical protein
MDFQGLKDGESVPLSDNIEITEIHCHECNGYIKFALDKDKNGEHVVICPKCKHEHCRIIKDGVVTGDRWSSRNTNNQPPQVQQPTTIPTYYINVSMQNWSTIGWEVAGQAGNDAYIKGAWENQQDNSTYISTNTSYYIVFPAGTSMPNTIP